jgi:hypothetical protein
MPPLHSGIKMAEGGVAAARVPSGVPPFTLGQLRAAIPAHCFKRDTLKSFAYLLKDVFICAALAFGALYIDSLPSPARWVLWPLYWFWQVGTTLPIACICIGVATRVDQDLKSHTSRTLRAGSAPVEHLVLGTKQLGHLSQPSGVLDT